jgi:hypothetical protein
MNTQLHIDFDPVHRIENNPESQAQLDKHRDVFTRECWQVLKRMLQGEEITMKSGINSGISDIRRRAKDLIDYYNVPVRCEFIDEDGVKLRYKKYYISKDDIPGVMMKIVEGLYFKK